ncbi:sugar phosphate isomerase/epimerase [Nocardioides sp. TF02-7]|uniref:sugar phosphate isomerase/epimerase family protein n=1 Tax=Nocardioides sp. TF02-7 TaxID=2917724 RepID=UPI001F05DDA9|nr:sugar phosphate isomerase/epimerase [Nocardioides sp. TF02-7]UMG93590.1 sugar phosphate isomerase/epimerase [Nocardioides sp. TF02-7]
MCFGFDGETALQESLARKGAKRRGLLTAAAGGAAALTVGSQTAASAHRGRPHGGPWGHDHRRRSIPHDKISIQLYTLRDALGGEPGFDVVLQRLAQYGYEKVELAGYYGRTAKELRKFLDGLDIRATSSHDGISSSRSALRTKLENAATLRQRYVVVPYLASDSLSDWQQWADQMNEEAALARRYGLRYGYHNHAHEFTTDLGGGVTPWEVLTDRLDPRLVHLEVDLYWAFTGGVNSGASDPHRFTIDVIRDAPQAVRQYHVKDRDGTTGDMCDLGTGVIDFPRIFRKHRVEEYIVENDTPDVSPLTSAAVGHLYLDHLEY